MGMNHALRISGFVLALAVAAPNLALAEYPVIDATAIGKLTDQLSKMQEQIKVLTDAKAALEKQLAAIGKMGQITLPVLNAAKIGSRLRQDVQCLKPDFSKLMPKADFQDVQWNSICQAGQAYRDTLFINPKDLVKLPSWKDREEKLTQINERRQNILEDTTAKGLAQGDVASKDVEALNKAVDDLQTTASAATTSNDRLATIAQGQVVMARALAQQNQILAQLLKVQSIYAMQIGVKAQSELVDPKVKEGAGQ